MSTAARSPMHPQAPAVVKSVGASLQVKRLTVAIGAEIGNIDLGRAARDRDTMEEVRQLLLKHRVLLFRDQHITRDDHVAFASYFGPLEDHPVAGSDPEHPGLVRIYKDHTTGKEHHENIYHTDATWRAKPPMGAVLRCIECPDLGGDTIWVNMVEAYAQLPDDVKARIDGLRAAHSIEHSFGGRMPIEQRHALARKHPQVEHPVVVVHPETHEKVLYLSPHATHFLNYHTPERIRCGFDVAPGASELLNYLIRQAYIPEYQCRFRWEPGSVAFWDNRSTQHYAVQDYWPAVRRMERAAIMGDAPIPA